MSKANYKMYYDTLFEILNNESKKIRKQELKALIRKLKKEVNKK